MFESLGQDAGCAARDTRTRWPPDRGRRSSGARRLPLHCSMLRRSRRPWMLLAAGEKALPALLAERRRMAAGAKAGELGNCRRVDRWQGHWTRTRAGGHAVSRPFGAAISARRPYATRSIWRCLPETARATSRSGLAAWLDRQLEPLAPLRQVPTRRAIPRARREVAGPAVRWSSTLIEARRVISREEAALEHLPKECAPYSAQARDHLRRARHLCRPLLKTSAAPPAASLGLDQRPLNEAMLRCADGAWAKGRLPADTGCRKPGRSRVDWPKKSWAPPSCPRGTRGAAHPKERNGPLSVTLSLSVSMGWRRTTPAGCWATRASAATGRALGPKAPWRTGP